MASRPFHNSPSFKSSRMGESKFYNPELSPNLNKNTPINSPSQKNKSFYPGSSPSFDPEHFQIIHKENTVLRQENRVLKRKLNNLKKQTAQSDTNVTPDQNDLRDTIKKQSGQISDLKTRIQVLSKQCKMYEEIINKMEEKINKMNQANKSLERKNAQYRIKQKFGSDDGIASLRKTLDQAQKINQLKGRVNEIIVKYSDLESQQQKNDEEWQQWKQKWGYQKKYYLNRIKDLQQMLGICQKQDGNQHKDFLRKRQISHKKSTSKQI